MSKGAPDYTKLVSLKGRDADGNDVSVLVDSTGRILAVLQGAVEVSGAVNANITNTVPVSGSVSATVSGSVNATPTTTVRQAQGHDGSQYRDLAVDTAGRMIALIKGSYDGVATTVSLDDDGNLNARLKGKYGAGLLDVAVDTLGRMIVIDVTNQAQTNRIRATVNIASAVNIICFNDVFQLIDAMRFDVYDEHNDNVVDTNLWSVSLTGNQPGTVTEVTDSDMRVYAYAHGIAQTSGARATTISSSGRWFARIKASTGGAWGGYGSATLTITGASTHNYGLPNDSAYHEYTIYFCRGNLYIRKDGVIVLQEADANSSMTISYYAYASAPGPSSDSAGSATILIDRTGKSGTAYTNSMTGQNTGTILTDALVSTAALNKYWERVVMNLAKNGSTHASPLQVKFYGSADSYVAALNANWVTIPEAEYASLLLERPVLKTATSNGQTTWGFTALTGGDALINEIGAQYLLLLELAADGTNYVPQYLDADYTYNDTNRKAPVITLLSGTGIVSGTSKLRATMVVDVIGIDGATKNTSIKVWLQENRTAVGEASPSIDVLAWDATKYLEAYYVSGYW